MRRRHDAPAPLAALEAVVEDGPAHGAPLIRWLLNHPSVRALPSDIRDDLVQSVGLTLLQSGPQVLESLRSRHREHLRGSEGDRRVSAYVAAMLRNRKRDHLRRLRHVELQSTDLVTTHRPDLLIELRAGWAALERATEHVSGHGSRCTVRALRELWLVATGRPTLESIIGAASRDAPGVPLATVRDRVYKRHGRARHALLSALDHLESVGQISSPAATRARQLVPQLFLRRQASTTRPSGRAGSATT